MIKSAAIHLPIGPAVAGLIMVMGGCSPSDKQDVPDDGVVLQGEFAFKGSRDAFVDLPAVHYKFAERNRKQLELDEEDRFRHVFVLDSSRVAWIEYDDQTYPVFLKQGETITLHMDGAYFPKNISQQGGDEEANQQYQIYLEELAEIEAQIDSESNNFRESPGSDMLDLYRQRIALAEDKLKGSSLELIVHRTRGEYIVKALEQVRYLRDHPDFNAEQRRREILEEARDMGVFTSTSLKAQRAGIRDITHAYAMSYGVEERLQETYGEGIGAYEMNRLAYEELDSLRTNVLNYIEERDAEAYARMYLVAERIGEAPFEKAEPTYHQFMDEFSEYEEYVAFLEEHYASVKAVQPGQPAIEFAYDDVDGNTYTLNDFEGNQVLLTFWASWCANCRYQKQYMEDLYERYAEKGFEIVAISIEEHKPDWEQAVKQHDFPWVDLYAGGGFTQETFMSYRAGSIPFYVLIDEEGNISGMNNIRPSVNLDEVLAEHYQQ